MFNVNLMYLKFFTLIGVNESRIDEKKEILPKMLKIFIEEFPAVSDEDVKSTALVIFCVILTAVSFIAFRWVMFQTEGFFYKNDSPADTGQIPAKGENPEWDTFLEETLSALGLTAAQVTGALLWEIWKAYQLLLQSGDPVIVMKVLLAALKEFGLLIPQTLPIFIFISILFFTINFLRRDIKNKKIKDDEIKKRELKNDKILENLDKALQSEGFKGYLESWGYAIKKSLENWIKNSKNNV